MGVFDSSTGMYTGALNGHEADANRRVMDKAAPAPVSFAAPQAAYVPQAKAVMADPTLRTVQDNELTSSNLVKLGARGSPLVTQARTSAAENAAERGLMNTGMAQQSAEQGVIQSLLPIAGADASTYSNVAAGNQGYQNQFGLANQAAQNQFGLQTNQFGFQGSQAALDRNQTLALQGGNQSFAASQAALDRNQALALQSGNQSFASNQALLDRNQAMGLLEKNQQYANTQTEKNQAYLSGQAEKDRAARQSEFSQTLAKQNEQFLSQQGLNRDQLNWNMQQASTSLNTASFNNYASAITSILDGTNPDKGNIIKKVNTIFFGNEDGSGDFKLKLSPIGAPAAPAPAPAPEMPVYSANPPAENQPAVYDEALNNPDRRRQQIGGDRYRPRNQVEN